MQSSSMTIFRLGRQTQLVQLRSMATIKEKVGTLRVSVIPIQICLTLVQQQHPHGGAFRTLMVCHLQELGGRCTSIRV